MKKVQTVVLSIVIFFMCANADSSNSIVGTWIRKKTNHQTIIMMFTKDKTVSVDVEGDTASGVYSTKSVNNTIHLDIEWKDTEEKISTIMRFKDKNQLEIENVNPGDPRPTEFSEYSVILSRQK